MKREYSSPVLVCERFIAEQSIAGNCTPGVNEDFETATATCDPGSQSFLRTLLQLIFGGGAVTHIHGVKIFGINTDYGPVSTTVFTSANASCSYKASESDLSNGYVKVSWSDSEHDTTHYALVGGNNYYFNS